MAAIVAILGVTAGSSLASVSVCHALDEATHHDETHEHETHQHDCALFCPHRDAGDEPCPMHSGNGGHRCTCDRMQGESAHLTPIAPTGPAILLSPAVFPDLRRGEAISETADRYREPARNRLLRPPVC